MQKDKQDNMDKGVTVKYRAHRKMRNKMARRSRRVNQMQKRR